MKRAAWTIGTLIVSNALIGCQRGEPPTLPRSAQPATTKETSGKSHENSKTSNPVPDALDNAARDFLQTLVSGDIRTAVEKTSIDFRKRVSGTLTFEEERKLGFSNGDTAEFLGNCRGNSQGFQVVRRRRASDGQEYLVRGNLGGNGQTRPFTLRLVNEEGNWRVAWFFAAAIPDPPVVPEVAHAESVWAAEVLVDFLTLVFGSDPEHRLTMSLMSEDLKASLPSPSVADPGLKYAKRDVRAWLNSLRMHRTRFEIDAIQGTPPQAAVRGRLLGQDAAEFQASLSKDGREWKITGFQLTSANARRN